MIENIFKRSKKLVPFDPDKLNDLGEWSVEGTECSWPLLVTRALKKLHDGCTTKELMKAMIDTAGDMIEEDSDWQYVASKLTIADLRKDVFASFEPPSLKAFYYDMTHLRRWRRMDYEEWELKELEKYIDHDRDENFTYAGIKQVLNKYLITDLSTKAIYETPQFMYMGVALAKFETTENKEERLQEVIDEYNNMSLWISNVPTPILKGLRTFSRGFASCCLVEAGDTIGSIDVGNSVIFNMTAKGAGTGYTLLSRSIGDSIRAGHVKHGGKLPYYRGIDKMVHANTQPGRGGSCTIYYTLFDPEIETLIKLKSDKVSEAVRIKHMDYALQSNAYLHLRAIKEPIPLFSLIQAPEVWEAFFGKDINKFIELYEAAEKRFPDAKRIDLSTILTSEEMALDTGRIYAMDVYETNRRSTFKAPVVMSNLCLEVLQPTGSYANMMDLYKTEEVINPETGRTSEVSLCTLAAHNIDLTAELTDEELERVTYLTVKGLDNLIDHQDYPFPNMEFTAKARRNLGIGITNLAGALARRGLFWSSREARTWAHNQLERISFFLHKASIRLAKERGACDWFDRTTYSDGVLPIDNFKKFVDTVHDGVLSMPWEELRRDLLKYGMRHSVLEAQMPCESSSQATCSTNGAENIQALYTVKKTAQGINKSVVPYYKERMYYYEPAWEVSTENHFYMMAVIQKFYGQAISTNRYKDYSKYPEQKIPLEEMLQERLLAFKLGLKTIYYTNSDTTVVDDCESCSV